MSLFCALLLCTAAIFTPALAQDLTEGDECELRNGDDGLCTHPDNCPSFAEDVRKNVHPQICEFQGLTPIICCKKAVTRPQTPPTVTRPQTPPTVTKPPVKPFVTTTERISKTKCIEYNQNSSQTGPILVPLVVDTSEYMENNTPMKDCSTFAPFVVGGEPAKEGAFPHMAALGFNVNGVIDFQCGGSLISEYWVLTAAHCLNPSSGPVQVVRLGETSLTEGEDINPHEDFEIAERVPHPQYRSPSMYHDVALLRLSRSAAHMMPRVRPGCLPEAGSIPEEDVEALATGWGYTVFGDNRADHLQVVGLNVVGKTKCDESYDVLKGNLQIPQGLIPQQMCAGNREGKDTCQGDSGGPLQLFLSSLCAYEVIGITSFGGFCGAGAPGVYTKVSDYVDWIESVVWKE